MKRRFWIVTWILCVAIVFLGFFPFVRYEAVSWNVFNRRFEPVILESGFQPIHQGFAEAEELPLLLRFRFPRSGLNSRIGFPDSAAVIHLENQEDERIEVRIEYRRDCVCYLEISGIASSSHSARELVRALEIEFPALAIFEGR